MPQVLTERPAPASVEPSHAIPLHSPPDGYDSDTGRTRRREVLRQASVALGRPVVTLWEVSAGADVVPVLTSVADPPHHATVLDVDRTLRRWGVPIIEGSAWVGCQLAEGWCLAPVRTQPASPPPGLERRSRERMICDLTGLLVGLVAPAPARPRLPEADALQDLSRQPSIIAHEVANPLTAAVVTLELTRDEIRGMALEDGHRVSLLEHLGEVGEGIERAVAFLRAIQDRARGTLARSERFDATRVVQACVTLERPLARQQGVLLQGEVWGSEAYLHGDPNALYRLLTNLIRNAVQASRDTKRPVLVEQVQVGWNLRLTVRDEGVGIAAEHLERIFEPGFTTKPLGTGSGTGLSIVRDTAERMFGGSVRVDSAPAVGTTVTVTLPIPPQRSARGRRSDEGRLADATGH